MQHLVEILEQVQDSLHVSVDERTHHQAHFHPYPGNRHPEKVTKGFIIIHNMMEVIIEERTRFGEENIKQFLYSTSLPLLPQPPPHAQRIF